MRASWQKTHQISTTNRFDGTTSYELYQFIDESNENVKTLPITKTPQPEFRFGEYGLGVMTQRCEVSLISKYNGDDFTSLVESNEAGHLKFCIRTDYGDGEKLVFIGFLEHKNIEEPFDNSTAEISIDFISGHTSARETPFTRTDGTGFTEILPSFDDDFIYYFELINSFATQIGDYPNEILYACSNLMAEHWRVYNYPKGTQGVEHPNVLFRELFIPVHNESSWFANETTLSEFMQDLVATFFCCLGYSFSNEKLMMHHYYNGADLQDYLVLGLTGLNKEFTTNQHQSIQHLDVSLIDRIKYKPKRIRYSQIQSIEIERSGEPSTSEASSTFTAVNFLLNKPFLFKTFSHNLISGAFTLDALMPAHPAPENTTNYPGRLIDVNFFGGVDSGLLDCSALVGIYWAHLLFLRRSGLQCRFNGIIDPMLPIKRSDDGTVHRLISGRHDFENLWTEFVSIEIGPRNLYTELAGNSAQLQKSARTLNQLDRLLLTQPVAPKNSNYSYNELEWGGIGFENLL